MQAAVMKKLGPEDYLTSEWSGGRTTQIAIFPPEAVYAERSFLWRVSSASVELEESDFTVLPDYERCIATLRGSIQLRHNEGTALTLSPYHVHRFSGADRTQSRGRCTDFNLMLRRGRAEGAMEALSLRNEPRDLPLEPGETLVLYCVRGAFTAEGGGRDWGVNPGETLLAIGPQTITLSGSTVLMLCRIRIRES